MIFRTFLLCSFLFFKTEGSSHDGCLQNPQLCDAAYQFCVDDGIIGTCISKQYSWPADSQDFSGPYEPQVAPNDDQLLTPEKRRRLTNLVLKVKQYLHANNIEFSDLTNEEIDELAQGIAEIFLQQEKELRVKQRLELEAYLKKLGVDDLAALFTTEQLNLIEKEILSNSGSSRDQKYRNESLPKKTNQNAKHQSHSSARKPMINPAPSQTTQDFVKQTADPAVSKFRNDPLPPEDALQVRARNDDTALASDSRNFEETDDGKVEDEILGDKVVSVPDEVEFAEKTEPKKHHSSKEATYIIVIVVLLVVVICIIVIAVAIYCMKSASARNKLLGTSTVQSGDDYQALCRQHYASKANEKAEAKQPLIPKTTAGRLFSPSGHHHPLFSKGSRNSSQSSWSEEPVTSTLDISTGHTVLAYMEDHLNNKDRLDREWEALCSYKAENVSMKVAEANPTRNRCQYAVPYDHNRVKLQVADSSSESDYVNASYIIDNDPRWPVYIATQGPLSSTVHHFWQMIWEQGCVVIVMLTPLMEEGLSQCARYWPDEGSSTYDDYEIHLVSEHIWCEDYLVRSLYLKNLNTGETRTVTQFHFLSWPADGVPSSSKQLLELRRKVSKCYRGNALSPVVVHCSDGCGRAGSYMLLDLVIARMVKGTCKEIDIAATLEHLRDQRAGRIVATKEQLEFVLSCVADEVNAILKVLLQ